MKTAIYIEDGIIQLVLTPENNFEENCIRSFEDKPVKTEIFSGTFYDCRGGWIRQKEHYTVYPASTNEERSLIIKSEIIAEEGKK